MTAKEYRENPTYYQKLIFDIIEENYDTIFNITALTRELNRKGNFYSIRQITPIVMGLIDDHQIKRVNAPCIAVTSYKDHTLLGIPIPKKKCLE